MSLRSATGVLALAAIAAGCTARGSIEGTDLRYRRVRPAVAYEILRDSPDALILDLRAAVGESSGSLGRARHVPLAELPAHLDELVDYRERTFLVYCGGDRKCGEQGMRLLLERGCSYAVLIDGRLDGWTSLGAEPAAGPPPDV